MSGGTVTVRFRSNWQPTESEAENECRSGLDTLIDRAISDLERDGKEVVGGQTFALDMEDRDRNGDREFRCSGEAEIDWVEAEDDRDAPGSMKVLGAATIDKSLIDRFNKAHPPADDRVRLLSLKAVQGELRIQEPTTSIPIAGGRDTYVVRNPYDVEREFELEFKVETRDTESFKVENSISTTWDIKVEAKGEIFGASAGMRREVSLTKTHEERSERIVSHSMRLPVVVQPQQSLQVTVSRAQMREIFPLKGEVTFDGTIRTRDKGTIEIRIGGMRARTRGIVDADKSLSEELGVSDRTFAIDGELEIQSSANTRTEITFGQPTPLPQAERGVGEFGVTRISASD